MASYFVFQKIGRNRRPVPKKKSSVYVEGRLQNCKYTGKDGVEKYG